MSKTLVIYNAHTLDGQAGALAAYYKIGKHSEFMAFDYGKLSVMDYFIKGTYLKVLYVIGLHLTANDIARLCQYAQTICYIDHVNVELPETIKNKVKIINIPNRCTCVTAWAHFMPTQMIPQMFHIIEDVVLGKNEITNSRSAYEGLRYRLLQCEENAFIMNMQAFLQNDPTELIMDGLHVGSMFKVIASNLAGNHSKSSLLNRAVACINAPKLFGYSICHNLMQKGYDYVLLYSDCCNQSYVYRSWTIAAKKDLKVDAAKIALLFNGFGTERFAGFTTTSILRDHDIIHEVNRCFM
jgi:hypothetical protein